MDFEASAAALDGAAADEILRCVVARFAPRVTLGTGFGVEGCILIDMIARRGWAVDLFTLDTGLFFPETYDLWGALERRYGVTIRAVRPRQSVAEQAVTHGHDLWRRDPGRCCALRKVEPLQRAVAGFDAWITAIRRDQSPARERAPAVAWDQRFNLVKVNPLVNWTANDVWDYARRHRVPYNPLHERGYPSIGCAPCTTPVRLGETARAGRWRGQDRTECGLHVLQA